MDDHAQLPGDPNRAGKILPVEEHPGLAPAAKLGQTPPVALVAVARDSPQPEPKDGFREIVETIVFVVVLVLLLKTFLAEAFVIPTGSMATTLLGYHMDVRCESCGYHFRVNASDEAEKRGGPVVEWVCPNCRLHMHRPMRRQQEEEAP